MPLRLFWPPFLMFRSSFAFFGCLTVNTTDAGSDAPLNSAGPVVQTHLVRTLAVLGLPWAPHRILCGNSDSTWAACESSVEPWGHPGCTGVHGASLDVPWTPQGDFSSVAPGRVLELGGPIRCLIGTPLTPPPYHLRLLRHRYSHLLHLHLSRHLHHL